MNHKQLVQRMGEMQAELEKYQSELQKLQSQVSYYEDVETPLPVTNSPSSRRKVLKRMAFAGLSGIAAVGLAAAASPNYTVLAETVSENAIDATAGSGGYGLKAAGGLAPVYLAPAAAAGTPTSGAHQKGELYVDSLGNLFYCISNGTPGIWRKLAGPESSGTLHLLTTPTRMINTQDGTGGASGAYTGNRNFTLGGVGPIPSGATGIVAVALAYSQEFPNTNFPGLGYLTIYPAASSAVGAPAINSVSYDNGLKYTSSLIQCGLVSGKLNIAAQGVPVNVIMDVVGYYM